MLCFVLIYSVLLNLSCVWTFAVSVTGVSVYLASSFFLFLTFFLHDNVDISRSSRNIDYREVARSNLKDN